MKLLNILCIALIAVSANCHRHHRRHSNFAAPDFSEINELFKMMNDFTPNLSFDQEIKVQSLQVVDTPVVGGNFFELTNLFLTFRHGTVFRNVRKNRH